MIPLWREWFTRFPSGLAALPFLLATFLAPPAAEAQPTTRGVIPESVLFSPE